MKTDFPLSFFGTCTRRVMAMARQCSTTATTMWTHFWDLEYSWIWANRPHTKDTRSRFGVTQAVINILTNNNSILMSVKIKICSHNGQICCWTADLCATHVFLSKRGAFLSKKGWFRVVLRHLHVCILRVCFRKCCCQWICIIRVVVLDDFFHKFDALVQAFVIYDSGIKV